MTTLSTKLGLVVPTLADVFSTSDIANNWGKIDQYHGTFICTSTSHPTTWTGAQTGMHIFDTDTSTRWVWNGTAFVRYVGKGLLTRVTRLSPISTAATTPQVAVQATSVTIPQGGRTLQIVCEIPSIISTSGAVKLFIYRDTTVLQQWEAEALSGSGAANQPTAEFATTFDVPSTTASTYSLQFSADVSFPGTATLGAATNQPLAIAVIEI